MKWNNKLVLFFLSIIAFFLFSNTALSWVVLETQPSYPIIIPADGQSKVKIIITVIDPGNEYNPPKQPFPRAGDSIAFNIISGGGSISPTASSTNSAGKAYAEYTAGTNGEIVKVSISDNTIGQSGSFDIYVVKIKQDYDLWWFNGENAVNYNEEVTLTAEGASNDWTYNWDVIQGSSLINLENDADSITKTGNTVKIKSTGGSLDRGDVIIKFSYGNFYTEYKTTVFQPKYAELTIGPIDQGIYQFWGLIQGFITRYWYRVKDQFNQLLPKNYEFNEYLSQKISDYPRENWGPGTQGGGIGNSFYDTYAYVNPLARPKPVTPWNSASWTKVFHHQQTYYVGSRTPGNGINVKTHVLQFYRGRARQL